jgi:predicted 2-oxoglutarate/Fe(II)-dependent dioxygenase YbiX
MRHNNTLENFISVYDNVISENSCQHIIQESTNLNWIDQVYNVQGNFLSEGMEVCFNLGTKSKLILDLPIKNTIETYIKTKGENLFSVKGISPIRLNRYKLNSRMHSHIDHQPVYRLTANQNVNSTENVLSGIPILTLIGTLNDDYEGGEIVFWDDYQPALKAGSVVIFPSNFLFKHTINTIKTGTRYSFIVWVW